MQLERGMRVIDSPGVVFDDDSYDDGKGGKKSSVLLRNVVKVEDVEDPIAVGSSFISTFLVLADLLVHIVQSKKFLSVPHQQPFRKFITFRSSYRRWNFLRCWH